MWIAEKDGEIKIYSNNPEQYILSTLKENHPGWAFYRSIKPCINEVNGLLFAVMVEPGDLIEVNEAVNDENGDPILDEHGDPIIDRRLIYGPSKVIPNENKPRLGEGVLIVEAKDGVEIARFDIEAVQ